MEAERADSAEKELASLRKELSGKESEVQRLQDEVAKAGADTETQELLEDARKEVLCPQAWVTPWVRLGNRLLRQSSLDFESVLFSIMVRVGGMVRVAGAW